MKSLNLWTAILTLSIFSVTTLTIFSCTSDDRNDPIAQQAIHGGNGSMNRITGLYPENSKNIYDAAGQLHNDISEAYLSQQKISTTTAGTITQVEDIANVNAEFLLLKPSTYISPSTLRIDNIINNVVTPSQIIANSSMTAGAKASLTLFLNTLMEYRDQQKDYDFIYQFIIDYEMGIIDNATLSSNDKRVILITTSISRYGFDFARRHRRKPRDRDWEISWGNIVAGTDGADTSDAKAIVMSAVCGIISNK
jgi:hypothetical protein